jgi:hypothetical protein
VTAGGAADDDGRKALVDLVGAAEAAAHLTLAWRPQPGSYTVQRVEIEAGLSAEFLGYARTTAGQLAGGRTEAPYDPEWPLKSHEYFALEGEEIPGGNLFPDLADFLSLPRFERKALRKPRLYTVAVQGEAGTALFGKRMAFLKQLGRRKGKFSATWDGSTFNELEGTVATFSTSFDWVLWDELLYVLDANNFHAEFRDQKALREAVQGHVDLISAEIEIIGAEDFAERCKKSVPLASKLQNVVEHGIWKKPVPELKAYAAERGIPVEWDGDALVFDGSIDRQSAILKLLDEDRTHGPVSGRTYDSAAKQAVEVPAPRPGSPPT